MRNIRKKERALSYEEGLEILRDLKIATISLYDEEEKFPYAVIINPVLIDETVYFHCAGEGHKIDVLKRNNRVCLSGVRSSKVIEEKLTTAYESVIIRSKARFVESLDEKSKALEALCKKFTPSVDEERINKVIVSSAEITTIVALKIDSLSAKGSNRASLA